MKNTFNTNFIDFNFNTDFDFCRTPAAWENND